MLRILHLEDRREDIFLTERALTQNGIEAKITAARDYREYISALENQLFDLILLDNAVPGLSGLEALEVAHQKSPDAGVIFLSGAVTPELAVACLKAGATDYILKDHPWQLVAALRCEEERLRLLRSNRGMSRLVTAVQELSLAHDLQEIMTIVRRAARELTGADGATFVLREGNLCHYADEDAIAPLWKGQRFPLETCISGWAMLNRQPAVIEDIYADPRIPADAYRPTFVKSLAMVPIRTEAPIGAIGNYWAKQRLPTTEEVALLQALANTTAVAMEKVRVYSELELHVKERTAQLEAANRELESFSYAVSHDLAAPLRSIRGYSELLLKGEASDSEQDRKAWLEKIHASSLQMTKLIADLLRLSNLSTGKLQMELVDLSKVAQKINSRLASEMSDRDVELNIVDGMKVDGDAGLLTIVLENLFSNAWKYTSKTKRARIEFGSVSQPDGSTAHYVKDNGAGFDMLYAHKLFQPFQRMHSADEYPGSGVGLATVQRIIQRHGGRVWVEAEPNRGATFYFTLAVAPVSKPAVSPTSKSARVDIAGQV